MRGITTLFCGVSAKFQRNFHIACGDILRNDLQLLCVEIFCRSECDLAVDAAIGVKIVVAAEKRGIGIIKFIVDGNDKFMRSFCSRIETESVAGKCRFCFADELFIPVDFAADAQTFASQFRRTAELHLAAVNTAAPLEKIIRQQVKTAGNRGETVEMDLVHIRIHCRSGQKRELPQAGEVKKFFCTHNKIP